MSESRLTAIRHVVLEHYATNAAARAALVVAIPVFGGGIDALLETAGTNLLAKRQEAYFQELRSALDAVQSRLDETVTEEDLYDLAIRVTRASIETGDREKVRLLVAILAAAGTTDRPRDLDVESIVADLANLSPTTLHLARILYELSVDPVTGGSYGQVPPSDYPDPDFHIHRLVGAGLIEVVQPRAERPDFGPGAFSPTRYAPTQTFSRVMTMVRIEPT